MTIVSNLNETLKKLTQLAERLCDIEFLFCYPSYSTDTLMDYLVKDYGFDREELEERTDLEIWGELEILQHQYGLTFEYIPAYSFPDEDHGGFRYQLSAGGPREEFIFTTCPEHYLVRADYWLGGEFVECTRNDTVVELWRHFRDTGRSKQAFHLAMSA